MLLQENKKTQGFTLIELLVVIVIIVMIAAMSLPTMVDVIKKGNLKSSASIIQSACLQARSQAISQRERHFVVLFARSDSKNNKDNTDTVTLNGQNVPPGKINTVQIFDSNENTPGRNLESLNEAQELPLFVTVKSLGMNENYPSSLILTFSPTGSIRVEGAGNQDFPIGNKEVFQDNEADIVIEQDQGEHEALIDIIKNTGQVHFEIRNKP